MPSNHVIDHLIVTNAHRFYQKFDHKQINGIAFARFVKCTDTASTLASNPVFLTIAQADKQFIGEKCGLFVSFGVEYISKRIF